MDLKKPSPVSLSDFFPLFFATGFFISYLPSTLLRFFSSKPSTQTLIEKKWTGAGLLGSIEGALMYLLLPAQWASVWWVLVLAVLFAVWTSGRAEEILASHDDSRIVIDEWTGVWVALFGLPQKVGVPFFLSFVFFRLFDVIKGPLGRRLQQLPRGWGVTLDDVYAGVAANIFCRISVGLLRLSP